MDDTPRYLGVHIPPQSVDNVAFDAAVARLTADATRTRYQAQSVLTVFFDKPEPPTLEQARDILAWASRKPRR